MFPAPAAAAGDADLGGDVQRQQMISSRLCPKLNIVDADGIDKSSPVFASPLGGSLAQMCLLHHPLLLTGLVEAARHPAGLDRRSEMSH